MTWSIMKGRFMLMGVSIRTVGIQALLQITVGGVQLKCLYLITILQMFPELWWCTTHPWQTVWGPLTTCTTLHKWNNQHVSIICIYNAINQMTTKHLENMSVSLWNGQHLGQSHLFWQRVTLPPPLKKHNARVRGQSFLKL